MIQGDGWAAGWGGHEGVGVSRQRQMAVFGKTKDTCRLLAIYYFFLGVLVLGAPKKTLNPKKKP